MSWLDSTMESMDMNLSKLLGDSEGHKRLACCSPRGHKELDMTEQLNGTELNIPLYICPTFSLSIHVSRAIHVLAIIYSAAVNIGVCVSF